MDTHGRDGSFQLMTGHTQRLCTCGASFMGTGEATQAARDEHIAQMNSANPCPFGETDCTDPIHAKLAMI